MQWQAVKHGHTCGIFNIFNRRHVLLLHAVCKGVACKEHK